MPVTFLCPACGAGTDPAVTCTGCGHRIPRFGSVFNLLDGSAGEAASLEVETFYDRCPFPGYQAGDDATVLLDRCRRSAFLAALDASIPTGAEVLDGGCGTGQLAAFLAIASARRRVFAADRSRAALSAADRFRTQEHIGNLTLLRADLFELPFAQRSFEVVVSRGVVHHTPDPPTAIRRLADLVAPGGHLVLGWYESMGRFFHHWRQRLHAVRGEPIRLLDPVLRQRDLSAEKKATWIEDQYRHPLEVSLPLPLVLAELRRAGLEPLRSVPPAPPESSLLAPGRLPGPAGLFMRRLGWLIRGSTDPDAGLVSVVSRRPR